MGVDSILVITKQQLQLQRHLIPRLSNSNAVPPTPRTHHYSHSRVSPLPRRSRRLLHKVLPRNSRACYLLWPQDKDWLSDLDSASSGRMWRSFVPSTLMSITLSRKFHFYTRSSRSQLHSLREINEGADGNAILHPHSFGDIYESGRALYRLHLHDCPHPPPQS